MSVTKNKSATSAYLQRQITLRSFFVSALAVLIKDIRCELRARHALSAILLFAVTSTVAVSFTLGAWGSKSAVASALLWLVIYFSAMSGLSRTFVREEEANTAAVLKLSAVPCSVYLGKLAFNFVILIAVEIIAVPLFVLLSGCSIGNWALFSALLVLGSLGLSAGATTTAAMVAKASVKGALFAAVSFPLLIPVLAISIHGTGIAMDLHPVGSAVGDIKLLVYYSGIVITASLMLFKFIWEE